MSFSRENGKKAENGSRQAVTTGKPPIKTPILASGDGGTGEPSKPVRTKPVSASITTVAEILALLQTDFYDLQSLGLKVTVMGKNGRLYMAVEYPEHNLDTGNGHFTIDGVPVSKIGEK